MDHLSTTELTELTASTAARTSVAAEIRESWRELVAKYQAPDWRRSTWQLVNTLVPYFALCAVMYWSLGVSYFLTLALALPAAGLLVRVFIISHDCGHGSYFKSGKANAFWGSITSFICYNPYYYWKHEHALHHANNGNLDKRGHGDIWTMTVYEYLTAAPRQRLAYRIYRNPVVLFLVGALYVFLIGYRITPKDGNEKDRRSVRRMNLALLTLVVMVHFTIGIGPFLAMQLPVLFLAAAAGAWLFYVQHQYEGVYWERKGHWDYVAAALDGSSYYELPAVLQWFTGNIGFHHIHHLSSKIPNYNLPRCHRENPIFQKVTRVNLWTSLRCLKYRLWDEQNCELISFRRLRKLRRTPAES